MVLKRLTARLALLMLLLFAGFAAATIPAVAHKNHNEQAEAKAADAPANAMPGMTMDGTMSPGHDMAEEAPKTWPGRILDWAGRMHPFAVHFPIALIPVSWLALIIARRRGDTVDLIRGILIFAGVAAFGAALLGWLNAGFSLSARPLLESHRWAGTGLGVIGAAIALLAWRKASVVNSRAMVWTLGLVTLALLVQGWLGGALTHGLEHMMI
ncbi:hypothetical protein RCO27_14300 [Sphingosinicella sp. LHD-64]|uniref:hypothetical protein n=1 Tax=Sphingosinicella sp. LHD-64 TaxID=3072139 RepID=UPI00280EC1C7|nr:hypothetical protein [Sphingosinicella sp. LHD-64]MDQ8757398.1 hypothetical protein [Sphingosinicella sp. LHD-64]